MLTKLTLASCVTSLEYLSFTPYVWVKFLRERCVYVHVKVFVCDDSASHLAGIDHISRAAVNPVFPVINRSSCAHRSSTLVDRCDAGFGLDTGRLSHAARADARRVWRTPPRGLHERAGVRDGLYNRGGRHDHRHHVCQTDVHQR